MCLVTKEELDQSGDPASAIVSINPKNGAIRAMTALGRPLVVIGDEAGRKKIVEDEPKYYGIINKALEKIEDANRLKLAGVFRNIDFNSEANLGRKPIPGDTPAERPRAVRKLLRKNTLHGEVVVLDDDNVPDFNALQNAFDRASMELRHMSQRVRMDSGHAAELVAMARAKARRRPAASVAIRR